MAGPGRQSQDKRFRERKKKEKRDEKLAKRAERKADKEAGAPDSDIIDVSSMLPAMAPIEEVASDEETNEEDADAANADASDKNPS
jgi:hypothetical protein